MKKFLSSLFVAISMFFCPQITDAKVPDYLGGNKEYILIHEDNGTGYYLQRSTIDRYQPNPAFKAFILIFDVHVVPGADKGATTVSEKREYIMKYQVKNGIPTMVVNGEEKPRHLSPTALQPEVVVPRNAGEMAWFIVNKKKFYGTRRYNLGEAKHAELYSEEFYARAAE